MDDINDITGGTLTGYVPWTSTNSIVVPGDLIVQGNTEL